MGQTQAAALGGEALPLPPELFALTRERAALFFRLGGHADDTHGPLIAPQVAIQIQSQFAGVGFVGHHTFVQGIELVRVHHKGRDAEGRELAVQMKTTRAGFVNHNHLVGQRDLFLHENQEGSWGEPLRWLGRLAITHPDDPEMINVPVHTNF